MTVMLIGKHHFSSHSMLRGDVPFGIGVLPVGILIDGAVYDLVIPSVKRGTGAVVAYTAKYERPENEIQRRPTPYNVALLKEAQFGREVYIRNEAEALEILRGKAFAPTLFLHDDKFTADDGHRYGMGGVYIVEEFADGTPLVNTYDLSRGTVTRGLFGRLPPQETVRLVGDLAEMTREIHAEGVALNDWKLEDVIVRDITSHYGFKVVDWNGAQLKEGVPERWSYERAHDVRALAEFAARIFQQDEYGSIPFSLYEFYGEVTSAQLAELQDKMERSHRGSWPLVEPLFHVREDNLDSILDDAIRGLRRALF